MGACTTAPQRRIAPVNTLKRIRARHSVDTTVFCEHLLPDREGLMDEVLRLVLEEGGRPDEVVHCPFFDRDNRHMLRGLLRYAMEKLDNASGSVYMSGNGTRVGGKIMHGEERFVEIIEGHQLMLAEAAVCERLRRMEHILLHPTLFNTPLIFEDAGRRSMEEIYGQYRQIALEARVPILLCAPTWRVDRERIRVAGVSPDINREAVEFMRGLANRWDRPESPVIVGGLIGPKNDCYLPDEALDATESVRFHQWQVDQLAEAGVEVIIAQTLPALSEAEGMARAMAAADVPYLLSFVINRHGQVFDGTPLAQAVSTLDRHLEKPPYGYMVNCAHPSFLCADQQPAALFTRLLGIQANSSSRDQTDLDGSSVTHRDSMQDWIDQMLMLNRIYNLRILGGCCGTDERYLQGLVRN